VTGVCAEPAGFEEKLGEAVSAGVVTMAVGDFDGDRREDVLGIGPRAGDQSAKVRVHYFGDGAVLGQVTPLAAPISSPAIRDFDLDGIDDFAFGLTGAFGIMRGQRDRSLVPVLFPTFRVPQIEAVTVVVKPSNPNGRLPSGAAVEVFYAGRFAVKDGGVVNAIASALSPEDDRFVRTLPAGPETIVGDLSWGPMFTDGSSTCGEVVLGLAIDPGSVVQVYSPCAGDRWASLRAPTEVKIAAPLHGGVHIADFDGDKILDLLIGTKEAGAPGRVYLARGTGSGFAEPTLIPNLEEAPLASGDFNGDGAVDFVLPSGLFLSRKTGGGDPDGGAGGTVTHLFLPLGRRSLWTSARVARLNADGIDDIVAASRDEPDIDFLPGNKDGFVLSTISSGGAVPKLAIADLDGDTLDDVVFVQERPGSKEQDIAVAYARSTGPPEPARVVGRTANVTDIELIDGPDAPINTLALFTREPPEAPGALPGMSLALIAGSGDRQPLAPLLLLDGFASAPLPAGGSVRREWAPVFVAAAPLAAKDRVDLIALAVGYDNNAQTNQPIASSSYPLGVWAAEARGGIAFETPHEVFSLPQVRGVDPDSRVSRLHTAVADLDAPPDGLQEVVTVGPGISGPLGVAIARPGSPPNLLSLATDPIGRDGMIAIHDVDGDGQNDLVALVGSDATTKVVVFFGDGKGSFDPAGVPVTVPPQNGGGGEDTAPTGFTLLVTKGAAIHRSEPKIAELAIVTRRRVVLAHPSPDRTAFETRVIVGGEGSLGRLADATGIAAGDFDGDGVEDLAIADAAAAARRPDARAPPRLGPPRLRARADARRSRARAHLLQRRRPGVRRREVCRRSALLRAGVRACASAPGPLLPRTSGAEGRLRERRPAPLPACRSPLQGLPRASAERWPAIRGDRGQGRPRGTSLAHGSAAGKGPGPRR
jgi:VCBS repeat protein